MKISELTRRDIFDTITSEKINWAGRLNEVEFLSRLYDLSSLPSYDSRYKNAAGDIGQHRINNFDWSEDWVFDDDRLKLRTDDDALLKFLAETIHPVVRPDVEESKHLCATYNKFLINDGFRLVERLRISNKPVYAGQLVETLQTPGVSAAHETFRSVDSSYVSQQITRMESAVASDPSLAIGTAKELVETCCKTILSRKGIVVGDNDDIPKLVKATIKELSLTPDDIEDKAKAADTIKRLLSNLATITSGIAELRNHYGSGHGKIATSKGLQPRHAKLAVGAASTLAVFLFETYQQRVDTGN